MHSHADVVKKSFLKYKASKIKGRNAVTTQGPRTSYKELFVVFRAPSGTEKFLDFYQNDRKYTEAGPPKWSVDLSSVTSVNQYNDNRVCFYLELEEGGACLFEARTVEAADEWTSCFNAVLFTRGAHGENLFYEVDLYQSEQLEYHGPAYLELAEGFLIVWTGSTQEEVVRWKLSHIRSFKAKKSVLTIYTGSRSSTGVGDFYFNSPLSVQITHAIETLVARLKSKKVNSKGSVAAAASNGRVLPALSRPLPPAPKDLNSPDGMPGILEHESGVMRTSVSAKIPGYTPPEVYEDLDSPFSNPTPQSRPEANGRVPRLDLHTGPVASKRRGGYEEVPDGPFERVEASTPGRAKASAPGKKPSPPPPFRKKEPVLPPTEAVYAEVDKNAKRKSKRPSSIHNLDCVDSPVESYGQLQHFDSSPPQPAFQIEEYGKLAHLGKPAVQALQPEEYGKLEHNSITSAAATCGYQPEEYGKLEHNSITSTAATCGYQPEEYGKLVRSREATPPSSFPEYGKLQTAGTSPNFEEHGKLNSFDPYGTLGGEELEVAAKVVSKTRSRAGYEMIDDFDKPPANDAIYSEVDEEIKAESTEPAGPPPGYENTVLKVTPAEKASYNRHSSLEQSGSPTSSPMPPSRKMKHSYVNVNDNGKVKAPEVAPRKSKSNGVLSPTKENGHELTKSRSLDEPDRDDPLPPVPPQRGITVHAHRRHSPQPAKRPPTAPKPKPLVKPLSLIHI